MLAVRKIAFVFVCDSSDSDAVYCVYYVKCRSVMVVAAGRSFVDVGRTSILLR